MAKKKKPPITKGNQKEKGKTPINREKFVFKTIIDGLIAGLIAIGIFLGRPANIKPIESYYIILGLLFVIFGFIFIYYVKYGMTESIIGLIVILFVAIIEVSIIGYAFQESTMSILIAILIVLPSVIIFDKLLG
jgi:hypothetical protein